MICGGRCPCRAGGVTDTWTGASHVLLEDGVVVRFIAGGREVIVGVVSVFLAVQLVVVSVE